MKLRLLLGLVILSLLTCKNVLTVHAQDLATIHKALTALYKSTNGDQWTNNTGWDTTAVPASRDEFNSWYGVSLYKTWLGSDNMSIKLANNNLSGTLPSEIGLLTKMDSLILSDNNLTGLLPPEIGKLEKLAYLILPKNKLSGAIPREIGKLKYLSYFVIWDNELESLPREIGGMSNLNHFHIQKNKLSGEIPEELEGMRNLRTLNLSENNFSGPISTKLGRLESLEFLFINDNQLTGELPRRFLRQFGLRVFHFHNNAGFCVPADDDFQQWLQRLQEHRGPICAVDTATEEKPDLDGIQFYPNPVVDYVTFTDLSYDAELRIFDLLGRTVLISDEARVDLSELLSGLYIYIVSSEVNGVTKGKLIKQ